MEWIQRHISTLGGDPSRVTIIGESAGAGSILHQITAYGGERKVPFSQAIVQSPGFYPITSDDVMEKDYQLILDAANCSSRPDGLDCLKSLSEQQLKQVNLAAIDAAPYGQFKVESETVLFSFPYSLGLVWPCRRRFIYTGTARQPPLSW